MINQDYNNQVNSASERFDQRKRQRDRAEKLIGQKKYFSIDTPDRVDQFLKRRGYSQYDIHNLVKNSIVGKQEIMTVPGQPPKLLEMIIGDNNLMSVCFLQKGVNTSPATGRIKVIDNNNQPVGFATGFMVSPQLLLTNHHVLGDETVLANSLLEFNYQTNLDGTMAQSVLFGFDPQTFYFKDENLDFVLIAVKNLSNNGQPLSKFGWNKLIEDPGKAIIGQYINIIQHPNGDPKEICIRDNQLIDIFDDFLHYKTDTLPGSSGSGLYNDQWEIIGLHHASLPVTANGNDKPGGNEAANQTASSPANGQFENEGIRISSIIQNLKTQNMNAGQRAIFQQCFTGMDESSLKTTESTGISNNNLPSQTINSDGSATWTIPVSITVNVGNGGGNISAVPSSPAQSAPVDSPFSLPVTNTAATAVEGRNTVLQNAQTDLGSIAHVIGVGMGYRFEKGKITNKQAIVVTMDSNETAANPVGLPAAYQGFPLEVLGPGLQDILIQMKNPHVNEMLLSKNRVIDEIVYTPPAGVNLTMVQEQMDAVFHVSPEEGWKNLQPFLEGTNEELVVGMYDFGAKHILNSILTLKNKPNVKMSMAIQKGQSLTAPGGDSDSNVKGNDLTDQDVVTQLQGGLGANFDFVWVKIGIVNGWVASSYHIKVAVRDSNSIWLSSGNWQSSNQPDVANLGMTNDQLIQNFNREWHVIVENETLAKTYREFILNDIQANKKLQHMEMDDLPFLAVPNFFVDEIKPAAKTPYVPFPVKNFSGNLKIMPLLTPDNYFDEAINLINSATKSLWIENQSFNAISAKGPGANPKLNEFLTAVLKKQQAGLEVKIIFRLFLESDAKTNLMGLKTFGFDTDFIKVLNNCHTKGIIVDGETVMLGSQNITEEGISINRDASLIVFNKDVASYFAGIFDADWKDRATNIILTGANEMKLIQPGQKIPAGHQSVSLKEMIETL